MPLPGLETLECYRVEVADFVATVTLDRSFDNGVTWIVCSSDGAGSAASFTAPISVVAEEPEAGVIYSFNCSAFTSGTATYRMSQ